MKRNVFINFGIAATLILFWCLAAWLVAKHYYLAREADMVQGKTQLTLLRAEDLTDSIRRNLNYLGGIPGFFTHAVRVNNALSRIDADTTLSRLPYETRKMRWAADPVLKDLNQTLTIAAANFRVDIIYIVNAAGDAIASSNWDQPTDTIGTNFSDRHYFKLNKEGRSAEQYAVGKTTHVPGLYFSSPVFINGRFMGAVVAKANVSNLTFLIRQTDAFVTDKNGVIILSHDKGREMYSLAEAPVHSMSVESRRELYKRENFPELKVTSWGDRSYPSLLRTEGEAFPQIIASKKLPEYGLTIYVENDLPHFLGLKRERMVFFLLIASLGSVLILSAVGGLLYARSLKQSKERLGESERRFKTLAAGAFEGIAISANGRLIDVNNRLAEMLGLEPREMIGQPVKSFIAPEDQRRVMANIENGIDSHVEHKMLCKDGTEIMVEAHAQTIEQGGVFMRLTAIHDITEHKRIAERINHMASHDALTDLPNRTLVSDRLQQAIATAKRDQLHAALMFLDLDNFKSVNDNFGHDIGDLLLQEAARRIQHCIRGSDTVGRIGGDEFIVLLPTIDSEQDVMRVAEKIRCALVVPFEVGNRQLNASSSIGVAIYPEHGDDEHTLTRNADVAMYHAKNSGRNTVVIFRPEMPGVGKC